MRSSIAAVIIFTLFQVLRCQGGTPINRDSFFDLELLRHSVEGKRGNVMISPASIKSILGLILEGAGGQTAAEIISALRGPLNRNAFRNEMKIFLEAFKAHNPTVTIQNANALFVSNNLKLKREYRDIARGLYLANIDQVNFNNPKVAANKVNKWLEKKTHGLIPAILNEDEISRYTQIMVANALYFKAPWKNGFNVKKTSSECFDSNGVCRKVAMMNLVAKLNYAYVPNLKSHALELPYQGDRYSMFLLVPKDHNAEINLLRELPHIGLQPIYELMERFEVLLRMPKFDVEFREDMVGPLVNMRITTLFSQYANLSGIFDKGETANVNSMIHAVHMKVDEAGTVAAAAIVGGIVPLSNDQVRLQIDRPFLFFIKDNSRDVILFAGKIGEPTEFFQTNSGEEQLQVPQQIHDQPFASHIQQQASGQTNLNQATRNNRPLSETDRNRIYNQATTQPGQFNPYQDTLNQQLYQMNRQFLNNNQRQSSQLPRYFQPGALRGLNTRNRACRYCP